MRDPKSMAKAPKVHVFLETVPINRALSDVLPLLKRSGIYIRMGFPPSKQKTFEHDWMPMIFESKNVGGSIVTGTQRTKQLLQIASDNLKFLTDMPEGSDAQVVPFSESNEAVDALINQKSKAFRTVFRW